MRASSLLPLALASFGCASLALADVCSEKPWSLTLPKGTRLWSALPSGKDTLAPDLKATDSARTFLFLKCSGSWIQLMGPAGKAVWTHAPKHANLQKRVPLPRHGKASSADSLLTDGLLGEEGTGTSGVDDILAGGGGALKKGEPAAKWASTPSSYAAGSSDRREKPKAEHKEDRTDLGAGKIEGTLDNPGAVYVLSESSSSGALATAPAAPGTSEKDLEYARAVKALEATAAGSTAASDDFGPAKPSPAKPRTSRPHASGLNAGVSDDNRQFPAFLEFLATRARSVPRVDTRIADRVKLRVTDAAGKGLANATVKVFDGKRLRETLSTLADGSALLFPRWLDSTGTLPALHLEIETPLGKAERTVAPDGPRSVEVALPGARQNLSPTVDLLFVLDVTGSMQAQIDQLKNAIAILQMNLGAMPNKPRLRFGLVQYRDRGDDFIARRIPFTQDAEAFSQILSRVAADGGGDGPEDLQSALDTALHGMDWNPSGLRLGFVVTDAQPHLDYGQGFTYAHAAHLARTRGIKLHTVGCGSLPLAGEVVLRQISQATGGKYVFLTSRGESGENDGGAAGSVSHHTGSNWTSERLETALLRLAREEISQQLELPPVDSAGWFEAKASATESRDTVVSALFRQAFQELRDFSPIPLPDTLSLGVLPMSAADSSLRPAAAWLGQILSIEISRSRKARVVERGNLTEVLREQALQGSGAIDPASVTGTGKLLGADLLLVSALHARGPGREVVLKLLKVSTGELLSATRAKVDPALLP
jgi:Mg-chelatase subunit ChlD